jgi:hypothetical protein
MIVSGSGHNPFSNWGSRCGGRVLRKLTKIKRSQVHSPATFEKSFYIMGEPLWLSGRAMRK